MSKKSLMNNTNIVQKITVYPFKGVDKFYDITPLLADPYIFDEACYAMTCNKYFGTDDSLSSCDCYCGLESRGFPFGIKLAQKDKKPFYMLRKEGNLPNAVTSESYQKEYESEEKICISRTADIKGKTVWIVDDSVATGGTMEAAIDLMYSLGAKKVKCFCLLKLDMCKNKKVLEHLYYVLEEKDITNVPTIHIASTSKIKLDAVENVLGPSSHRYIKHDVPSNVPVQPIGQSEIELGATNRMNEVKTQETIIAIENGIIMLGDTHYDIACVKLKTDGKVYTTWSTLVPIDGTLVKNEVIINANNSTTIGHLISPDNPIDPHSKLTNSMVSRQDILEQAIKVVVGMSKPI